MSGTEATDAVRSFYDTHPINERQIVEKLEAAGVDFARLSEDDLLAHDQDHFGGIDANDALAARAGIAADTSVLDVACGLGGPSRYLAHRYGCRVTGVDLTASRVAGAARLTEMVGLADNVSFRQGNALDLPFDDASFDVVIGQEAFCHIPDKAQLIAECARVVRPGGRIAFTDILRRGAVDDTTIARLQREMTFHQLGSVADYKTLLEQSGCDVAPVEDLSETWRVILVDRLAMYRGLEDQTVVRFGRDHFRKWDAAYAFFVGLFETGELGGGRFLAVRRGD